MTLTCLLTCSVGSEQNSTVSHAHPVFALLDTFVGLIYTLVIQYDTMLVTLWATCDMVVVKSPFYVLYIKTLPCDHKGWTSHAGYRACDKLRTRPAVHLNGAWDIACSPGNSPHVKGFWSSSCGGFRSSKRMKMTTFSAFLKAFSFGCFIPAKRWPEFLANSKSLMEWMWEVPSI